MLLILALCGLYFLGVNAWLVANLAVFSLALKEYINFTKQKSKLNYTILQLILILLIIFPYIFANHISGAKFLESYFVFFTVFALLLFIFFYGSVLKLCKKRFKKRNKLGSRTSFELNSFVLLYIGFFPAHLFYLLAMDAKFLILALLTTISSDSAAYLFGKTLGKHKVLPKTSPQKTMEGSIAALLVGAVSFTSLYLWITAKFYLLDSPKILYPILSGLFLAFIAQLGDYYESLLKRCFLVKNSGDMLAAHGGILDRIDSHCLVLAFTYVILVVFHHLNL